MKRIWLAVVAAMAASPMLPTTQAAEDTEEMAYLFTSFRRNGQDGLHLAYSHDGYRWTDLKRVFLKPKVGKSKLMRDPCIVRGPDGTFHMVWTTGWWEKGIGYARSADLIHWSEQRTIEVMAHEPRAKNTWAPELFYDDARKQFLIFWATTIPGRFPKTDRQGDHNHRMYCVATRDFKTFSKARLFFDPGYNVIDATIIKAGGKHTMIFKDERRGKKLLRLAFSDQAEGPYENVSEPFTTDWVEGPSAIRIGGEWLVYFDHYARPHYYGAVRTKDFQSWADVSKQMAFPRGHRHGTVLEVPKRVLAGLRAREAAPGLTGPR